MKQNPDVLMDLVSDNSKFKYEYSTKMQFEDESPYIATHTETGTIPIHYVDGR